MDDSNNSLLNSIYVSFSSINHQLDEINTIFTEYDRDSIIIVPDSQKIKIRISLDFCDNEYNRLMKNIGTLCNNIRYHKQMFYVHQEIKTRLSIITSKLQIVKTKCSKRDCIIYNRTSSSSYKDDNNSSSSKIYFSPYNNSNNGFLLEEPCNKNEYDCQVL